MLHKLYNTISTYVNVNGEFCTQYSYIQVIHLSKRAYGGPPTRAHCIARCK